MEWQESMKNFNHLCHSTRQLYYVCAHLLNIGVSILNLFGHIALKLCQALHILINYKQVKLEQK